MTSAELTQLQKITKQVEVANVKRIEALGELAQIRNVSLDVVMAQLGLPAEQPFQNWN